TVRAHTFLPPLCHSPCSIHKPMLKVSAYRVLVQLGCRASGGKRGVNMSTPVHCPRAFWPIKKGDECIREKWAHPLCNLFSMSQCWRIRGMFGIRVHVVLYMNTYSEHTP